MYDERFVTPMRQELTRLGVEEMRTADEVDARLRDAAGTTLVVVNSMCGCAARNARPGVALALRNGGFSVLIDAIPVDLHPREPRFEISYLLLNPGDGGSGAARPSLPTMRLARPCSSTRAFALLSTHNQTPSRCFRRCTLSKIGSLPAM